ncbi:unnamed protein product [Urochloa humidicola]
MAIPVARVHLAMAHAALPGLLPSPPKCATMLPLVAAPLCATIILPNNSPPRPNRADAAERWDTHKTKQGGGSPALSSPPPPSAGRCSLDSKSSNPGVAPSCEKWVSNKENDEIYGLGPIKILEIKEKSQRPMCALGSGGRDAIFSPTLLVE